MENASTAWQRCATHKWHRKQKTASSSTVRPKNHEMHPNALESGPLFCRQDIPFMIDYLFQPFLVLQWSKLSLLLFNTFSFQTWLAISSLSEQFIIMVEALKLSQKVRAAGFCLQSNHWTLVQITLLPALTVSLSVDRCKNIPRSERTEMCCVLRFYPLFPRCAHCF